MLIKSNQLSYELLSTLSSQEQAYWIKWMKESILRRKSENHINWLKGLISKLETIK